MAGWLNIDIIPGERVDALCDVRHLPFRDRCFELVLARDLLHHVDHPEKAIAELGRVSRQRLEIWESNRYNPYMLIFMVGSGFTHSHFSQVRFRRLFSDYDAVFERGNNFDHPHSRRFFPPLLGLLKAVSLIIPSYNVAILDGRVDAQSPRQAGPNPGIAQTTSSQ